MHSDLLSATTAGRRIRLRIEGWRGVHHSFAMVNQHQILALARHGGFQLYHHDVPYLMEHWNARDNGAGFDPASAALIEGLQDLPLHEADAVLRVAGPLQAPAPASPPTLSFAVTEFGLGRKGLADPDTPLQRWTEGEHRLITPSRWSRERLIDQGFDAERIGIVPHGVDTRAFAPLDPVQRQAAREVLGLRPDTVVFLNVGVPTWNKGLDLLLLAFARVHLSYPNTRLILKDGGNLYGLSGQHLVQQLVASDPVLADPRVLQAITFVQTSLAQAQLRALYAAADCYVSPYRAEGFNLPVLEALACATPVIVTDGGATDDFCSGAAVSRIPGTFRRASIGDLSEGCWVDPDPEALVSIMAAAAAQGPNDGDTPAGQARREAAVAVARVHSWDRAAQAIHGLLQPPLAQRSTPLTPKSPEASLKSILPQHERQRRVLELLQLIRPWSMTSHAKVRLGNEYDGGYVVPDVALQADAVVSIGVGPDVSFDLVLAERGARIYQFDHTVQKPPTDHPAFNFYKLGWGPRTEGEFLDLNDILARVQPAAQRPLLKFDIEGGEYDVFEGVTAAQLAGFEVICCELHHFDKLAEDGFLAKLTQLLRVLHAGHLPVHLHANNYQSMVLVEGIPVPQVIELCFLRRDMDFFPGYSMEPIPGPLDRPNHPYRPDLCLNPF